METNSLKHIFQNPNDNGIIVFVLGVLFIITIFHFLLYFQHKDRVYLYYSLYTFLVFVAHLKNAHNGFIPSLISPIENFLQHAGFSLIWSNSLVYFIFAFTFVDLKAYSLKWYHFIFGSVYFLLVLVIGINIYASNDGLLNRSILHNFYIYMLIATSLLAIIGYIPLFKMKHQLKYYIIIGSLFLFISSLAATFLLISSKNDTGHSIFYFGIIIENILFSLGLGHKQKLILKDKNDSQEKLITQLQENEKLKNKVHQQLEQNVATLSKQAEAEKLEKLKEKYDKELAELKITSLRSQMNPHFIFNSLNSIKLYIINNEKENAVYYLNKFSKLIRKILATTREKEITLADEIETMELYLNIENIRFDNKIEYTISVDEYINIHTIKIPCLILQPFIENAIWHGLSLKKDNKKLEIIIEKVKQSHVKISIVDNGVGRIKSAEINKQKTLKKNSIGIKLTKERLKNFFKDFKKNHSITIIDLFDENKMPNGTKVIIKIPLF